MHKFANCVIKSKSLVGGSNTMAKVTMEITKVGTWNKRIKKINWGK